MTLHRKRGHALQALHITSSPTLHRSPLPAPPAPAPTPSSPPPPAAAAQTGAPPPLSEVPAQAEGAVPAQAEGAGAHESREAGAPRDHKEAQGAREREGKGSAKPESGKGSGVEGKAVGKGEEGKVQVVKAKVGAQDTQAQAHDTHTTFKAPPLPPDVATLKRCPRPLLASVVACEAEVCCVG